MAYAVLVSVSYTINQILQNHDKYTIPLRESRMVKSIYDHIIFLQALFEDFPEQVNSILEAQIRAAANQAEDVIEYFMLKRRSYGFMKLEKVLEEFDSLARQVMDIRNSSIGTIAHSSQRLSPSHNTQDMVGFEDHLLAIKERLCGESSRLQVVPIVGMGGIGKTTLARNAFHDPLIMHHFHIRAWVTVSQDYSAQKLVSDLLTFLEELNFTKISDHTNEVKLYRALKGRRYLIVMDDMWATKVWDDTRRIFPDDDNGSRVMLTTRLSDVASYADSCSPLHELHLMDEYKSWKLLHHKVFAHEDCPSELESIGREIAQSCSGLPLAIVMIAGLLLSTVSKTQTSWKEIAENVSSTIGTKDGQFEKIMTLSYNHLPHRLRPCFQYMGTFPEDSEIHIDQLTKMWVAEGFVQSSGSENLEETAEKYLEDLVKRSLVLVTKTKSNGAIRSCSVHDLVRELCIRKAKEDKFLLLVDNKFITELLPESITDQRCMAISNMVDHDMFFLSMVEDSSIRSILSFKRKGPLLSNCANLRLLRLLHSLDTPSSYLPRGLFELFYLRYLALSYVIAEDRRHRTSDIPNEISNLQNLQTLIIHTTKRKWAYPSRVITLPRGIWGMQQLRHVLSFFFDHMPEPEGAPLALENLQTLSMVTNFVCTKQILERICNLKKLGISYYGSGQKLDYQLENLVHMKRLESLKLVVYADFGHRRMLNPVFPGTLRKLTLSRLLLPWDDMTNVGSLPNLEVLKLRDSACTGEKWETNEGEFRELKYLLIDRSTLGYWITESSHFPKLKCLMLHRCWCLKEIPDDIGEITTLELIEVKHGLTVNKSLEESAKRIQEEQEGFGNYGLQVCCIPC